MEEKLKKLFDFQKFEKNGRVERMVSDAVKPAPVALSDDDLSEVAAAGARPAEVVWSSRENAQRAALKGDVKNAILRQKANAVLQIFTRRNAETESDGKNGGTVPGTRAGMKKNKIENGL